MYRVVDTRFWTDDKVRPLHPQAKLVFAYLITSPSSNMTGIFRYTPHSFAQDVNMTMRTFGKYITCIRSAGLISIHDRESLIWVRNMFKYQGTASPKVLKYVRAYLRSLPPSPLISSFILAYPQVAGADPKARSTGETVWAYPQDDPHNGMPDRPYTGAVEVKQSTSTSTSTSVSRLENDPQNQGQNPDTVYPAAGEQTNLLHFPRRDRTSWPTDVEHIGAIYRRISRGGEAAP